MYIIVTDKLDLIVTSSFFIKMTYNLYVVQLGVNLLVVDPPGQGGGGPGPDGLASELVLRSGPQNRPLVVHRDVVSLV